MTNRHLLLGAAISSVAVVIICVGGSLFSPSISNANSAPSQMMGGMGNREGMQGMMHEMRRDNVPPGVKPQNLPAPNSQGAKLTVRYCMQCHNLASPSMHTAKEWKLVAGRMFRRMSMASRRGMMGMSVNVPSSEQQKEILDYLESHALKSISPGSLGSPHSPGAAAFRSSCSQCHALPNPKLHDAAGWPAVVRKMQSYAKQMNKKEITDQQAKEIEGFLASESRH